MWKLSSNRLSMEEFIQLSSLGMTIKQIEHEAKQRDKQFNSNLAALYEHADVYPDRIVFHGEEITATNIDTSQLHRSYTPYIREHLGMPTRRNTLVTNDLTLSDQNKQVILGTVIGDGSIPKRQNYISMCQGIEQIDYLKWKCGMLDKLVVTPVRISSYFDKRTHKQGQNCYVKTIPHKWIRSLKSEVYQKQKRLANVVGQLNPLGLAVWYCDDGSIIHRKARICTNCYARDDIKIAMSHLQKRFGFDSLWINAQNLILFSAEDSDKLRTIISPFIPTCMRYKLEN